MDVIGMLNLDEMAHGLAGMTMFPYFDTAHYVVSDFSDKQSFTQN